MKIGDYVRFKDKRGNTYIRKVIDGYKAHWYGCKVDKEANNVPYVSAKNIIKSSPNIIDLIEVGDILKFKDTKHYQEVLAIDNEKLYLTEYIYMSGLQKYKKEIQEDIEWVITHEQIENMKYKVGDDK